MQRTASSRAPLTAPGTGGAHAQRNDGEGSPNPWVALGLELFSTIASSVVFFAGLHFIMKSFDPSRQQKRDAEKKRKLVMDKMLANGREPFAMNEHETIIAMDLVYPEDITETFASIGGLEHAKREIFDLVALPLRRQDLFVGKSTLVRPPKGILLYGPPGTGKTMMAKAIAKESGAAFINLKMSTTMDMWFGESQKLVRATFSLAWKLAPCIIFIDEIDAFLCERNTRGEHAALGNMKAEFMALWDGICTDSRPTSGYGIVVIGATNRPWDIDQAILRRMPRTFLLGLPDSSQRLQILRLILTNENLSSELRAYLPELASRLHGYSGSDIQELCRAAAVIPLREFAQHNNEANVQHRRQKSTLRAISIADFEQALLEVRATGVSASEYKDEAYRQPGYIQPEGDSTIYTKDDITRAYFQGLYHGATIQSVTSNLNTK